MSHFTVMVIGDDVEKQLQPYHEFECTGTDDEYIQNIDLLNEFATSYNTERKKMIRDFEGNLHDPYSDEFYRDPTEKEKESIGNGGSGFTRGIAFNSKDWGDGLGYRPKVKFIPEGWTEEEVFVKDVMSFTDFVLEDVMEVLRTGELPKLGDTHKYGWCRIDDKNVVVEIIKRTNPNSKWDWYQVGGRWNGFFLLKPETCGTLGNPGLNRLDKNYKPPESNKADVARKKDIDFEGMKEEARKHATEQYDLVHSVLDLYTEIVPWEKVLELNKDDVEKARTMYNDQAGFLALRKNKKTANLWWDAESFLISRDEYIEDAVNSVIRPFAFVINGKWHEKGEMGWWGITTNEKDKHVWSKQFNDFLDSLPEDTLLTIVDCHI